MSATPQFIATPVNAWATLTTQNTAVDGTGTVSTILTAGSNGNRPLGIIAKPLGTNVQSVLRVFLNNGSSNAVAGNNTLIDEITLPTTTASSTASLAKITVSFPDNFIIPSGYKINVTIGTTVSAGWAVMAFGGDL